MKRHLEHSVSTEISLQSLDTLNIWILEDLIIHIKKNSSCFHVSSYLFSIWISECDNQTFHYM